VEAQIAGPGIAAETRVDARQALGRRGEDLACQELTRRGYTIVDRRFRTRCGELDIVAKEGSVVVFIEVKTRSGCKFGSPVESLTWQKRRRLGAMAEAYLFRKRLSGVACRFDVVSILESTSGCTVELIRGAFDLESCHR
jgi:putative endonuclease